MRKFDRANGIVVATVALCFALTLSLCFLLSGKGVINSVFAKEGETRSFFAVTAGGYETAALARPAAELIKLRGGAGYVRTEDTAEIILAVYPDREAAESVIRKLSDKGLYVAEIATVSPSFKWADKGGKAVAEAALTYFELAYSTLYAQSNSLADKTSSVEDIKTQIKVLYAQIEDIKSDFYSKCENNGKEELTEIKLALVTALALLDNVTYSGEAAALSSLRYQTVQLVLCYKALCSSL